MGKKLPYTPNSRIRSVIRKLWLRSRERAKALQSTSYCCSECGVKQSKAKGFEVRLEVHHSPAIVWDGIFKLIRERILDVPQAPLCVKCHKAAHQSK